MNVKRIISLISLVVFLTTALLGTSAFAAESDSGLSPEKIKLMIAAGEPVPGQQVSEESVKIKKDAALEIAKTILENASEFESNNIYLNPGYGGMKTFWSINFYSKSVPGANAYVNVDADSGEVTGYNIWYNTYGQQNYVAKYTRDEAVVFADDFLKNRIKYDMTGYELQPEDPYANAYKMGGVREMFTYNFSYARKLNGILLPSDTVYISVDGTNGRVISFNRNSTTVDLSKLPSAENVLPVDKALEKYKASVNFSLQYITQYQDSLYGIAPKPKLLLAYVPTYYSDLLDAVKGGLINYDGSEMTVNPDQSVVNPVRLNPDAVLSVASPKTETEARTIAEEYRKTAEQLLGVKFDDVNNNQQVYGPQNDSWMFNWNKNVATTNYYFNLSVNKTTGRITNMGFGKYEYTYEKMMTPDQKPHEVKEKVTWSMGREKALEAVKTLAPDQYGFYSDQNLKEPVFTEEVKKTMREYYYNFTRVENGILFRDNTMGVNIDRETGEVKSFYMNWTDADFPQTSGIVTRDSAMARYFDGLEARLQYFQKSSYDQSSQMQKTDPVPVLIYSFVRKGYSYGGGMYVDASTGKLLDYSGREVKPVEGAAQPQLEENWAKRSVQLLIAQGVIKNPYIDYDTELTRAEAVKMVSLAMGNQYYYDYNLAQTQSYTDVPKENEYFPYVENAVRQGIIAKGAEFNGEEKITKEEFAVLLTNMTGYADLAGKTSIFKVEGLNVTDPANAGYVAICSALDFLPVKPGGTFAGSGTLTLTEAASALYKALSYIR